MRFPILPVLASATFAFSTIAVAAPRPDGDSGAKLEGKRVAILVTDGFEQDELLKPREALHNAGAKTVLIAPKSGKVRGWSSDNWGESVSVDQVLDQANASDFDALLLPGGVMSPDKLRMNPKAVEFVRSFAQANKPIAAICHGPWTLVEADVVKGKKLTSWPSLETDIKNAGGTWEDREVLRDGTLVTSRKPDDIPAFNKEMIIAFQG